MGGIVFDRLTDAQREKMEQVERDGLLRQGVTDGAVTWRDAQIGDMLRLPCRYFHDGEWVYPDIGDKIPAEIMTIESIESGWVQFGW